MLEEILYLLLLINNLFFKECLTKELGGHDLCSLNQTEINMNEVLNITSDVDEFHNNFLIFKEGSLLIWHVPLISYIYNDKYQKILSSSTQHDLMRIMKLFRAEIYVDIYINEPYLLEICGTKDPNTLLGVNKTDNTTQHCTPFFYNTIGDNDLLARLHFSQRFNDTLRVLEDFSDFMVQTSPWPYSRYYLSRLVFRYNRSVDSSPNLPTMNVILHDCSKWYKSSSYLRTDSDRNYYYDKLIYIKYNRLCACVTHSGKYNIIYNMNTRIGNLDLRIARELYDPLHYVIYADYTAVYDYIHNSKLQIYIVFDVNFESISMAYQFYRSSIELENEFWLNMTRIAYTQCSITFYSFISNKIERLELIAGERFKLRQTKDGVSVFIESRSTYNTIISYTGFLIKETKCVNSIMDDDKIFNISATPRFLIYRILKRC